MAHASVARFALANFPTLLGTVGLWSQAAAVTIWAAPPGRASAVGAAALALLYPVPTAALATVAVDPGRTLKEAYRTALRRYPAVLSSTAAAYTAATVALSLTAALYLTLDRAGAWAPLTWLAAAATLAVFLAGIAATFSAPLDAALHRRTGLRSILPQLLPARRSLRYHAKLLPAALIERLFGRVPILLAFGVTQLAFLPRTVGTALAALSAPPLALAIIYGAQQAQSRQPAEHV